MVERSPISADAYPPYEAGLRLLLDRIGRDDSHYVVVLTYQQRLLENIAQSRQYGDTETRRAERSEVIRFLNELALTTLGLSFNQLCYPPPFLVPDLPPHYVPRRVKLDELKQSLLGKEREIPEVALHGMGGVGKTTLAIAVCHDESIEKAFPDGILWATLGPEGDVLGVQARWGMALGHRELIEFPDIETRADRLRTVLRDKRCLMVIDDVWDRAHLSPLRVGGPKCATLVTTRDRKIARKLEVIQDIGVMEPDQAVALLEKWVGGVVNEDKALVSELARRLGYLPLALTLAGAQVMDGETWSDLLAVFQDEQGVEVALLDLEDPEARDESLALCFCLSVDRLSGELPIRFVMLGVFAAGRESPFTEEAAAAVWEVSISDARATLRELSRVALLHREKRRFTLDLLLGGYARSRLDEATQQVAQMRHALYYLEVARAANELLGTEAESDGLSNFEADRLNILTVHRFLSQIQSPDMLKLLCQLHRELSEFYDRSGRWREHVSILEQAVKSLHTAELDVQHELGELEIQLAIAYRRQMSNLKIPLDHFLSGLERISLDKLSLHFSLPELYRKLGDLYRVRGEFGQALTHYQKAEDLLPQEGEANERGKLLSSVADAYLRQGVDLKRALQTASQSLDLQLIERDDYEIVQSHRILADVHLARGEIEESAFHIDEACKEFEEIGQGFNPLMGWILRTQGDVRLLQDAPQSALACYERALEIFKIRHVDTGVSIISKKLGLWQLAHGDIEMALERLDGAVATARSVAGSSYSLAENLLARYEGGLVAKYVLSEYAANYQPEQTKRLSQYVEANGSVQEKLTELVKDNEDLAILWERFNYLSKQAKYPYLGTANSVAAKLQHDPLDALNYAARNSFRLVQVHLSQCTDASVRKELVAKSQEYQINLMCHAPRLLNQVSLSEVDSTALALEVLRSTRDKWVVHHFDEQESLDVAFRLVSEIVQAGLVPCIENYHQLEGPERAYENYRRYKELFSRIAAHELPVYAVLDIPRAFHAKVGLSMREASELMADVFRHLVDLGVPILLHLIDSQTAAQKRKDWCPLGTGVIPYSDLLRKLFALPAQVEAVVFEYEDKENPLKSRSFLEQSIRARVSMLHPELSVRWLV